MGVRGKIGATLPGENPKGRVLLRGILGGDDLNNIAQ
jgi:hypothetical protein